MAFLNALTFAALLPTAASPIEGAPVVCGVDHLILVCIFGLDFIWIRFHLTRFDSFRVL